MLKEDLLKLPEEIQMFVAADADDLMDEIGEKFSLSREQKMDLLDLLDDVFLKKTEVLSLTQSIDKMPGAKNFDVRLLTLDIAHKILWPLQGHLGEVDKLIIRLGGKVPRIKPIAGKIKDTGGLFPGQDKGTLQEMMDKYNDFKELRLSANKIIDSRGHHLSATVDNWLKDYVHFAGAGARDSLKRAQYLSKEKNPLSLSEADRESLRFLLVSHDESLPMSFDYQDLKLKIKEPQKTKAENEDKNEENTPLSLENIFKEIDDKLVALEKNILEPNFILSEAEGEIDKVKNVLWSALALGDKEKTLGCLKLLATKKKLDALFKEDSRFKNILKRFVGIKFGQSAEKYFDNQPDALVLRRLFLEMIFREKFHLNEEDSAFWAFYLSNFLPDSEPIVYLDKKIGQFKWRELEVVGQQILWQDKL